MSERRPGALDWDAHGKILIWDSNNGCMVGCSKRRSDYIREPIAHWQRIPRAWTRKALRMPTAGDADAQGCVLILDADMGARVKGWNDPALADRSVVAWQRLPSAPEEGKT